MNLHNGIYRYSCEYCGKGYTTRYYLQEHLTSHTNIKYFKCKKCNESFRTYNTLRGHKVTCKA